MIRVKKISHASYETPDLAAQTEYYTDVLGLSLVGSEKGVTYLGGAVDHHSIALRDGSDGPLQRHRVPDRAGRGPGRVRVPDEGAGPGGGDRDRPRAERF